jgi:hypothetical protein
MDHSALYFPSLPWPWSLLILGAVYGAETEENERGSPSVGWVSGSGTHGSFCLDFGGPLGLWRLWSLCWGTMGGRCVSMVCP